MKQRNKQGDKYSSEDDVIASRDEGGGGGGWGEGRGGVNVKAVFTSILSFITFEKEIMRTKNKNQVRFVEGKMRE